MTTPQINLGAYERAERAIAHDSERTGRIAHGLITVLVSALLVALNLTVADGFPWSAFAVGGMVIGLVAHWWGGYRQLDQQLEQQQYRTERRAAEL